MTDHDLRPLETFLTHEAHLLDAERYEDWLGLFTADATYWVPAKQDQEDPFAHVSLIYDDRRLLETRVRRLSSAVAHTMTPRASVARQVTNFAVVERNPSEIVVRSKFCLVEYRRNAQRVFAGTYVHRLHWAGAELKIASKRVNLINCAAELEGLLVPF
jgi:benzoate/toluate 1,2-dioxygenase beta subunit